MKLVHILRPACCLFRIYMNSYFIDLLKATSNYRLFTDTIVKIQKESPTLPSLQQEWRENILKMQIIFVNVIVQSQQ